jgi:hypothetical protein
MGGIEATLGCRCSCALWAITLQATPQLQLHSAAGNECSATRVQVGGNKEKMREQSAKVERNQQKAQQKGAGKGNKNKGMMVDDDTTDAVAKPKKWNDYSVKFTFPDPATGNQTQLLQLIDAHFKYPRREDFGMHDMNVGIGMGSRVCRLSFFALLCLFLGSVSCASPTLHSDHRLLMHKFSNLTAVLAEYGAVTSLSSTSLHLAGADMYCGSKRCGQVYADEPRCGGSRANSR